jgi:hypothetical protein
MIDFDTLLIWAAVGCLIMAAGVATAIQRRRNHWRKRRLRGDPAAKLREMQRRKP